MTLNIFNKKMKIRSWEKNSTKYFAIIYPKRYTKYIPSGAAILSNVLKKHNVIIHVDTSLCFYNQKNINKKINEFRNELSSTGIPFEYRTYKGSNPSRGILNTIFQSEKKNMVFEVMTFALQKGDKYTSILEPLMKIGCQVFVPVKEENDKELISKVFNANFNEEDEYMYSLFKCILYMNDSVYQAVVRTKKLEKEDIEKMIFD